MYVCCVCVGVCVKGVWHGCVCVSLCVCLVNFVFFCLPEASAK